MTVDFDKQLMKDIEGRCRDIERQYTLLINDLEALAEQDGKYIPSETFSTLTHSKKQFKQFRDGLEREL